jgi:hypothetical protein
MFRSVLLGTVSGAFACVAWGAGAANVPASVDTMIDEILARPAVPVSNVPVAPVGPGMPTELLSCVKSSVVETSDRFGKPIGSPGGNGSFIKIANGGSLISYAVVPGIANSHWRDQVLICLVHIPNPLECPAGDERGREYTVTNLRTLGAWTGGPDQHMCGGA